MNLVVFAVSLSLFLVAPAYAAPCCGDVGAEVEIEAKGTVCDGKEGIPVTVTFDENADMQCVKEITWDITPGANNPSGKQIEVKLIGDSLTNYEIPTALWNADGSNAPCNDDGTWNIKGFLHLKDGTSKEIADLDFTVNAGEECVAGWVVDNKGKKWTPEVDNVFSGKVKINIEEIGPHKYRGTVEQGTFKRDVKAKAKNKCKHNTSQYYDMVQKEEEFHVTQLTTGMHKDLWLAENVMKYFENRVYRGHNEKSIESEIMESFNDAISLEMLRCYIKFDERKCEMEREAKAEAEVTHRGIMRCTKPNCK